jgi:hypothetical protein
LGSTDPRRVNTVRNQSQMCAGEGDLGVIGNRE